MYKEEEKTGKQSWIDKKLVGKQIFNVKTRERKISQESKEREKKQKKSTGKTSNGHITVDLNNWINFCYVSKIAMDLQSI